MKPTTAPLPLMRRALTLKDLEAARRTGQPTIVQTVEGAHFIEGASKRAAYAQKVQGERVKFLWGRLKA